MSAALHDPRRLRERIEELEEQVRQLREALAPRIIWPLEWGLRPFERAILSAIHACAGIATYERLVAALWHEERDDPYALLKVHVWNTRRKLAAIGVDIATVRGIGYRLPPASRAILDAALEGRS